jgi:hypothetical protein
MASFKEFNISQPRHSCERLQQSTIDSSSLMTHVPETVPSQNTVKEILINGFRCAGNCGEDGGFVFYLACYLCKECRKRDEFRTICRSEAIRRYGLTIQDLLDGFTSKKLRMWTTKNARFGKGAVMRLHNEKEIADLALQLNRTPVETYNTVS